MIEQLERIDRSVFLFLNELGHPYLDMPMWYISSIILWVPLFIFFLYYAYKKAGYPFVLYIFFGMAFCVLLSDRISVEFFKEIFQRVRPTHNEDIQHLVHTIIKPNGHEYRGGLYSFVSSHATNFFAIATFLFFNFKQYNKFWWLIFPWAILIGYSRIYLGVHYPADIIGGAILGCTIGIFLYKIGKYAFKSKTWLK
ncbi:phosphatase PAP2 family protein [Putridiphycobacter roseus]|uniref:Phosphatase PAP2 family protein n=1 Tax=Putridiphycobacter roseus TaxID=2219161 RepID=A0A2W1NAW0_9FLAO|nr:phosphatase PAP2 family protein [Putridiphycobacter roseus]PZE16405.1 phosphatase PAP2 family protein [Putridiphycobacter roseus]